MSTRPGTASGPPEVVKGIDDLTMPVGTRDGYEMATVDGKFSALETREFPAGSFYVDMAQPMANAAFYYLEPQARDGFVGWRVLDAPLRAVLAKGAPAEYPIFKMRRVIK